MERLTTGYVAVDFDGPADVRSQLRDTVTSCLIEHCRTIPRKPCLIFYGLDLIVTYEAFQDACLRVGALLCNSGAGRGDIVMIFLPAGQNSYAALFGAMMVGAIPTYMPSPSTKQEPGKYWRDHAALFARTQPRVVLTDDATATAIRASGLLNGTAIQLLTVGETADLPPVAQIVEAHPNDTALLQHSSGTTGLKKGVMLSHAAIVEQVAAYGNAIAATRQDIVASWLPTYHDMGLIACTLLPLMLGQTVVVLDPFSWVANPGSLLQAISRYRATLVWQPNFAFEHLVRTLRPEDAQLDLSSVRAFVNCSEPCRPATFDRFAACFASQGVSLLQLQVSYAMAETVFACTQTRLGSSPTRLTVSAVALREEGHARHARNGEEAVTLLSNGAPIIGTTVWAELANGIVCNEYEVGELVVFGVSLFDGYFRLANLTAERLINGGFRTRDMGFIADGEVYVLGRLDDMIIVRGRNYYAGEIEEAANRVVGVKPGRAVAFGNFNADVGSEEVVIVAESEAECDDDVLKGLAKRVKQMIYQQIGLVVAEALIVRPGWLSKTTSGKISRGQNRERFNAERANRQIGST